MFGMFGTKKAVSATGNHMPNVQSQEEMYNKIGRGTLLEGTVTCEGEIRVEGEIDGLLVSKSKVVVGATGLIKGDIKCNIADISGHVKGKIQVSELLFLRSTAQIDGEIFTGKLVVEEGAAINGNCHMGSKVANSSSNTSGAAGKNEQAKVQKAAS